MPRAAALAIKVAMMLRETIMMDDKYAGLFVCTVSDV
jgi:hypothetical protein